MSNTNEGRVLKGIKTCEYEKSSFIEVRNLLHTIHYHTSSQSCLRTIQIVDTNSPLYIHFTHKTSSVKILLAIHGLGTK